MLFVTFHGGKPMKDPRRNNVHAYSKDGKKIVSSVLQDADGVILDELRAIRLFKRKLYVVNANKLLNGVLCYRGSGTTYRFASSFVSSQTCKGVVHPFDLTFDGAGYCYVSSQDTNVVTRLKISPDGTKATAAPVAPALAGQ